MFLVMHHAQHALPVLDPHARWSAGSARSSGSSTRRRTTASTTASTRATSTRTTPASSSSGTACSAPSSPRTTSRSTASSSRSAASTRCGRTCTAGCEIAAMARRTRRLRDKLYAWLAPPEWRPADLGGPVRRPSPIATARRSSRARPRPRSRVLPRSSSSLAAASWFIYAAGTHAHTAPSSSASPSSCCAAIVSFGWIYSPRARDDGVGAAHVAPVVVGAQRVERVALEIAGASERRRRRSACV